jgi:hypothetical protein
MPTRTTFLTRNGFVSRIALARDDAAGQQSEIDTQKRPYLRSVLRAGYTAVFPVSNDVDNDTCIMLLSNVYHNDGSDHWATVRSVVASGEVLCRSPDSPRGFGAVAGDDQQARRINHNARATDLHPADEAS